MGLFRWLFGGKKRAQKGATRTKTESTHHPTSEQVPQSVQPIVAAAQQLGHQIMTIARWSQALVVHMRDPLTDEHRAALKARFPSLEYFSTEGSPHNPPDEGFIDRDAGAAISFPRDEARPC